MTAVDAQDALCGPGVPPLYLQGSASRALPRYNALRARVAPALATRADAAG